MEEKKRPEKRVENPVREWVSDNLRYLILIAGIIVLVIIIIFVIRALQPNEQQTQTSSVQTAASSVKQDTDETRKTDTDKKSDGAKKTEAAAKTEKAKKADTAARSDEEKKTEVRKESVKDVQEEKQSPERASQATPASTPEPTLEKANQTEQGLIETYLHALETSNVDEALSVVENLSEEDKAGIANGNYAKKYSDVQVYVYPGDAEGAKVVFATYCYQYDGFDTPLPALSEFYIFTKGDQTICIGSDQTENEKAELLQSVLQKEEIQALIADSKQKHDAALAADPALAAYIANNENQ